MIYFAYQIRSHNFYYFWKAQEECCHFYTILNLTTICVQAKQLYY